MLRPALFPPEVVGDVPRVTLIGTGEARVEQHRGVVACQPGEVTFRTAEGELAFTGEGLHFLLYTAQEAVLGGEIRGVSLRRKGARK